MNTFGNLIWLLLGGLLVAFFYFLVGLVMCITIIGIPFGLRHFRMALGSIFPFGKVITKNRI